MYRRDFLQLIGPTAAAALMVPSAAAQAGMRNSVYRMQARDALREISEEPAVRAEVRTERGGPRLFVNDAEVYPFMALSDHLLPTMQNFTNAGIHIIQPVLGMSTGWTGPDEYDWDYLDVYLGRLLDLDPDAYFLPRIHLYTPEWWKLEHPEELIQYGLPGGERNYGRMRKFPVEEGAHYYNKRYEHWEASFASEKWREDTANMLRNYIRHIENSPLKSRILGYFFNTGKTGEWNYFGDIRIPDYSKPVENSCGEIPDVERRTHTTMGLVRDPEKEKDVIRFYQKFHDAIVDTILGLARVVREETDGRVLSGIFYGYVLEQTTIQEAGYLACEHIMKSPDLDFIACPNTYQDTNSGGTAEYPSGVVDGAGNWLGRARGVGGDGGFRIPWESVRRHGKLFISEIDPSTYWAEEYHHIGGPGSGTVEGTKKIMHRNLGQVFATGVGGWLYDFGSRNQTYDGWYKGKPIQDIFHHYAQLGKRRSGMDISSVSRILTVADDQSFAATQHWDQQRPWKNHGIRWCDFINHWFLNSQARTLHRIGAPVDFLYQFDFGQDDAANYPLIFMLNPYMMDSDKVSEYRDLLRDSGATVVWVYAPGYIAPDKLDLAQMKDLTGFDYEMHLKPGSMFIGTDISDSKIPKTFGVDQEVYPRFSVAGSDVEVLGRWSDLDLPAFARREMDGWTSVYVGAGPMPVELLRWCAGQAGVDLWSSKADNVRAIKDAAMIMASDDGERTLTLPSAMAPVGGGSKRKTHSLQMEFGEVRLFTAV